MSSLHNNFIIVFHIVLSWNLFFVVYIKMHDLFKPYFISHQLFVDDNKNSKSKNIQCAISDKESRNSSKNIELLMTY